MHGDIKKNKVFVKSTTLWRQESWKSIFPYQAKLDQGSGMQNGQK